MEKRFAIIVNPAAGLGKTFKKLPVLKEITQKADAIFDYYITESPHHGTRIADAIHREYDAVVAFGGDGTANEVMNGLAGSDTPFGLIPQGTGNDFARSIQVRKDLQQAVNVLLNYKIRPMDLGIIGNRVFLNGVGVGFDGFVNYRSKNQKFFKGSLSYLYAVLTSLTLWRAIPISLGIDLEPMDKVHAFLIAIGNGWSVGGGLKLTPQASIHDGLFDICHVGNIAIWKIMLNFARLKTGTIGQIREVATRRCKKITIESEYPLPVHFDGEVYDINAKKVDISIVPQSANVIGGWES